MHEFIFSRLGHTDSNWTNLHDAGRRHSLRMRSRQPLPLPHNPQNTLTAKPKADAA
ncbi:MAG: hypothetical protein KIH09_16965 [Candidatus Freyarchaeota archaeon]|nr:hypothetical protein [Candidatus Jordarchaeia archaeon]